MPQAFDCSVVRAWIALALEAVGEGREEIDAINVFPVADGDTGTNLQRTLDAAGQALEAEPAESGEGGSPSPAAPALRALARGALLGACGNSGTILAQLLRGIAGAYGAAEAAEARGEAEVPGGGRLLADALERAAECAYEAVAHPVEGTMLSVARAAAEAAGRACDGPAAVDEPHAGAAAVARAAHARSREALAETTGQLDVLRRAGVVDAGGSGLVAVLGALADALGGTLPEAAGGVRHPYRVPNSADGSGSSPQATGAYGPSGARGVYAPPGGGGGAYEVMYLLDAGDTAVAALRERLDGLGDSLVVGGGDGLWSVHVHVDDAGAAVEAGLAAGRPHRIRIAHLAAGETGGPCAPEPDEDQPRAHAAESPARTPAAGPGRAVRSVVAVVQGDGLAGLCEDAGALVVRAEEGLGSPDDEALSAAVRASGATEVVLLPNDAELHASASLAADAAGADAPELRVAVVPTRAAVQGVAALAVHDPERPFDDDVEAMTTAAGAARYGEVTVADGPLRTPAGVCETGDVLGLVAGEVAVTGRDVSAAAAGVLERMLAAGGELVTLIAGAHAPEGLADRLAEQVRSARPAVDAVVYEGGQRSSLLLIGVE